MENYVIENQAKNKTVAALKYTAQDRQSIITGLLAIFETEARARKVMTDQATDLRKDGFTILSLAPSEIRLANLAGEERILFIETYQVM